MRRSSATKYGVGSVLALPVFAITPIIFSLLFRPHVQPDFFYFAIAGVCTSVALCIPAVLKGSRWWLLSLPLGAFSLAVLYLAATLSLILLRHR